MDFGSHSIQIFVSLAVILAAAVVALVCDLLKGNNEHLRELAVELKVRHEEAERRIQIMEKRGERVAVAMGSIKPVTAVQASPAVVAKAPVAPKPEPVAAGGPVSMPAPIRPQRRREMSPAVAAVAAAAARIVNQGQQQQQEAGHAFGSSLASEHESLGNEQVLQSSAAASDGQRKNWDSILKKTAPRQGALIPFESIRDAVPAGYHEAAVLQRAVETGRALSGLVLSIGTNGLSAEGAAEVGAFLQSVLSNQDFGCQSGSDEYVLICPADQGALAQRRLSALAEKLWDFQLRSIGGLGVQFSWGSFEARGERIGEAVATAIEQMQDTRHARRGSVAKAV